MNFVKGTAIQTQPKLKQSFFNLAKSTFQLDFEQWDAFGYWDEKYCPYAFEDQGEIVANVSISTATMILNDSAYRAVQIGTVMTHPDYQGKGLSRKLMEEVLEDVKGEDFIYLFANKSVLQFYPKFGFETRTQKTFTLEARHMTLSEKEVVKINLEDIQAREQFAKTVKNRKPISKTMSIVNNEGIVMFHALTQYRDAIYYMPHLDTYIIAIEHADRLQVVDVIATKEVDLLSVISAFPFKAPMIQLCFTPDTLTVPVIEGTFYDDGAMFVKEQTVCHYPNTILYPYSALA